MAITKPGLLLSDQADLTEVKDGYCQRREGWLLPNQTGLTKGKGGYMQTGLV